MRLLVAQSGVSLIDDGQAVLGFVYSLGGKHSMRIKLTGLFAVFALIAAFGLALVGPGAVSAAPGGGATTSRGSLNYSGCFDYGSGYTDCYSQVGTYHIILTPSGNFIYQENMTYTTTYSYDDQVVSQTSHTGRDQGTSTPRNQEFHSSYTDTYSSNDGQSFCVIYRDHFAHGQYQYNDAIAC